MSDMGRSEVDRLVHPTIEFDRGEEHPYQLRVIVGPLSVETDMDEDDVRDLRDAFDSVLSDGGSQSDSTSETEGDDV